jgi:hypothetical protein
MTKVIFAYRGEEILVDDFTYDRLNLHNWSLNDSGYATTYINPEMVSMHSLIMNAQKGQRVDHINRNKLDNRIENLRFSTRSQNAANKGKPNIVSTSKYKGVHRDSRTSQWIMQITCDGKTITETYGTEQDAALAYDCAARELYGEFAFLNFPEHNEVPPKSRKKRRKTNSLPMGVDLKNNKYRARCNFGKTDKYLGLFATAKDAGYAYDQYVISINHPELVNANLRN